MRMGVMGKELISRIHLVTESIATAISQCTCIPLAFSEVAA
jgi:hypothetical protein